MTDIYITIGSGQVLSAQTWVLTATLKWASLTLPSMGSCQVLPLFGATSGSAQAMGLLDGSTAVLKDNTITPFFVAAPYLKLWAQQTQTDNRTFTLTY